MLVVRAVNALVASLVVVVAGSIAVAMLLVAYGYPHLEAASPKIFKGWNTYKEWKWNPPSISSKVRQDTKHFFNTSLLSC